MKALQAHALASVEDYHLVDLPTPAPGAGQVRIKVAACGVGYVDSLVSLGRYQVKPPLPHVPGGEFAGWVDALGDGVEGLALGDRVMAAGQGGFAEFALAPARSVTKIPDVMSFEAAAGFRINYLTAIHALVERAGAQKGETLLVIGAAGGVGLAAVQIGKLMGLRVIAVGSSEEKRDFARAHGADDVIDTSPEGWRDRLKALTGAKGPDIVFDPVCGPLFELAFRSLAWRGRHLVIGFVGGIPALPSNLTLMKGASLVGVDLRQFLLNEAPAAAAHLAQLMEWVASGQLIAPVGRVFSMSEARAALAFPLSGQGIGKTILRIA
ncbi:MAG: NADPH:quinone oxidoreductase family protein [Hyphomonadaceae bacterium]